MLKKLLSITLLSLICLAQAQAQELFCKVNVNYDKIPGVDKEVFASMQRNIAEFINTHKWGNDDYAPNEKIECNFFITLTGNKINGDPDIYSATLSVMASRPVFNTSYNTTIVNTVDREFTFKYNQFTPLNFDDNRVSGNEGTISNLTATLAFYCYIILGMDGDSFAPEGGTTMFKKAQNVVNNAPEQGKLLAGWKSTEGTKNRYWLVDNILNPRFKDVRSFWYTYHRESLDSMSTKPIDSRNRALYSVKKVYQVNRENPSSMLVQFIFAAKSQEIINLLSLTPKAERGLFITQLSIMDVPNAAKYNSLK